MEDAQGFFGNPSVGFLSMLVIGAIAGWDRREGDPIRPQHLHQYPGGYCGLLRGRGACQYSEHFRVRLLSYLSIGNHRRHSDSLYMASGASSASNYLIDVAGGE
jgi:hypothetical protein